MRGLTPAERSALSELLNSVFDGEINSDEERQVFAGLVASGRAVMRTVDLDDEYEADVYDPSPLSGLALRVCPKEEA